MLDIAEIPFFASLSQSSLETLRANVPVKEFPQGSIIVRVGDVGTHFYAIADGAVWVKQNESASLRNRGVLLGPGQVFGEMSLFSGAPISTTLVATKDTATYCIEGDAFLKLLEQEPALHRNLTKVLIERLRRQTHAVDASPSLIVLTETHASDHTEAFCDAILRGILFYAAGSDVLPGSKISNAKPEVSLLPSQIIRWRESAPSGQFMILRLHSNDLVHLQDVLEPRDVILQVSDVTHGSDHTEMIRIQSGVADFSRVFIGRPPEGGDNPWSFRISPQELARESDNKERWSEKLVPNLSRIARYLTYKEVGIAMSSGAARGFAHLGVLDVLDQYGVPFDVFAGSSMGGIVALTYARDASMPKTITQVREQLGGNRKIRDPVLTLPRGSIFRGNKIANAAKATFGDMTFSDLIVPTMVVSADLSKGERVIMDRGPIAPAVLATSAIPGFFPPIQSGDKLLVDGGTVSWVPVDILDTRRCGVRIAINVLPLTNRSDDQTESNLRELTSRIPRLLGFKTVLGASWELLGSWGSSNEALKADIVITPSTPAKAGYDFDQFDQLVEFGRIAARDRIEAVVELIDKVLHS